jgi:dolichol-phosphate mannosyltransferase
MSIANRLHALFRRIAGWRFFKFGVVGASGTVVNLCVLYAAQEWLFREVSPPLLRLNLSLALAIFVATINNFWWNRVWTWHDRRAHISKRVLIQFGQYAVATWLGTFLQITLTNLLAARLHYLVANLVAIAVASVCNFLANDGWTFGRIELWLRRRAALRARDRPAPPPS